MVVPERASPVYAASNSREKSPFWNSRVGSVRNEVDVWSSAWVFSNEA